MDRQSATEKLICETLIGMMENTRVYNIKVTDLVKAAGISRSTFYVYFDSINSVLRKIEDDFISGFIDENTITLRTIRGVNAESTPDAGFLSAAQYMKKNLRVYRILCGKNGDPEFQAILANRTRRIVDKLFVLSTGIPDTKKKVISEYLSGGRWYALLWWAQHQDEIDAKEMAVLFRKITNSVVSLL